MDLGKVELSKNITLLVVFLALIGMKVAGYNSNIDDLMALLVGAIIGKEVLSKVNASNEEDEKDD